MSYNKTLWKTNDLVTIDKINKIEEGIANVNSCDFVIFPVVADWGPGGLFLNKTLKEIRENMKKGLVLIEVLPNNDLDFFHTFLSVTRIQKATDFYLVNTVSHLFFQAQNDNVFPYALMQF